MFLKIFVRMSLKIFVRMSENICQVVSENIWPDVCENIWRDVSENICQDVFENIYQDVSKNIYQDVPENIDRRMNTYFFFYGDAPRHENSDAIHKLHLTAAQPTSSLPVHGNIGYLSTIFITYILIIKCQQHSSAIFVYKKKPSTLFKIFCLDLHSS